MAVLPPPVLLFKSAPRPVAVLPLPVVLFERARKPVAVFSSPSMLFKRAAAPTAVLSEPVVLNKSVAAPNAVFWSAVLKRGEELAGRVSRLIQDRLSDAEFGKNPAYLSNQFAASSNHRFEFQKRVSFSSAPTTKLGATE
jgi:hypothetical protein